MYHEPMDFAYAGYMAMVGELVEHVGEATGQWRYPGQSWGGVPAVVTAAVGRDRTIYTASGPSSGAATERARTVIIIATRLRADDIALFCWNSRRAGLSSTGHHCP